MNRLCLFACAGAAAGAAAASWLERRRRAARDPDEPERADDDDLARSSDAVLARLERSAPVRVAGVDPALHYLAPHVPKLDWTALGDLVAARERDTHGRVDGSRWLSLRLDGCGFSKAVRALRRRGVLEPAGFSPAFADAMVGALRALMEHVGGSLGFTQSDEMVVFVPPAPVVRGERMPHARNGRATKLATLAASYVTAHFVMALSERCVGAGLGLAELAAVLPHFDCRVGSYASWAEARALLLWRAYDCSVNGVSDAVHQADGAGEAARALGTRDKVAWLAARGRLPLPRHQAYGTVLAKVRRACDGHNPRLGTATRTLRGTVERVDGAVLELARSHALFPADDVLPPLGADGAVSAPASGDGADDSPRGVESCYTYSEEAGESRPKDRGLA